jgi:hypothetical protein
LRNRCKDITCLIMRGTRETIHLSHEKRNLYATARVLRTVSSIDLHLHILKKGENQR